MAFVRRQLFAPSLIRWKDSISLLERGSNWVRDVQDFGDSDFLPFLSPSLFSLLGWPLQPTHNNFNLALNIALGIQLSAQIQADKLVTFQERMSPESCSDTIVLKLPCLPTGPSSDMYYQYTFTYDPMSVWNKNISLPFVICWGSVIICVLSYGFWLICSEYAPYLFRSLRHFYGITDDEYTSIISARSPMFVLIHRFARI